jgi:ElaB/YqjD/DUF883 family membrane-anchored ribosome-binding protein
MNKTITKRISNEVDDLLEDVAHNLRKMAKHLSEDAGDALSDSAGALAESTLTLIDEAKVRSRKVAGKAAQQVREHPAATAATAAIAAGAVAVIGVALARRKSSAA